MQCAATGAQQTPKSLKEAWGYKVTQTDTRHASSIKA
jgi:hypothetical protein